MPLIDTPPHTYLAQCRCVRKHNPMTANTNDHHVCPKSWGGNNELPNTMGDGNLVTLCPTTHENVHQLLNLCVHLGRWPTKSERLRSGLNVNRYTMKIAKLGWEHRPSDKPPFTEVHSHA